MRFDFHMQFLVLAPQGILLNELARQASPHQGSLLGTSLRGRDVGVASLVVVCAKVADLDEALLNQCAKEIMCTFRADAYSLGQLSLRQIGVGIEQAPNAALGIFLEGIAAIRHGAGE